MTQIHPLFESILETHGICPVLSPAKKLMSEVHWLIHEASFAISEGRIDEAKELLAKADQLSHDDQGLIK